MSRGDFYEHFCSVEEIVKQLNVIYDSLSILCAKNPYIIFTISPQRYAFIVGGDDTEFYDINYKSHLVTNTLSKSVLKAALGMFLRKKSEDRLIYFPSYEIVLDELRQYECFSDGLHVSIPSVSHVVARFANTFFSEKLQASIVAKLAENVLFTRTLGRLARDQDTLADDQMLRFFSHILGLDITRQELARVVSHFFARKFTSANPIPEQVFELLRLLLERFPRLVFWGVSGRFADHFLPHLIRLKKLSDCSVTLVDSKLCGTMIDRVAVQSPKDLKRSSNDCIVITTTFRDSVMEQMDKLKISARLVL